VGEGYVLGVKRNLDKGSMAKGRMEGRHDRDRDGMREARLGVMESLLVPPPLQNAESGTQWGLDARHGPRHVVTNLKHRVPSMTCQRTTNIKTKWDLRFDQVQAGKRRRVVTVHYPQTRSLMST